MQLRHSDYSPRIISGQGESTRPNRHLYCCKSTSTMRGENNCCKGSRQEGCRRPLVRWIGAFCSGRTATILVNGFTSQQQQLPQAGLPQGSPLSPILFLFFNADLVQHKLNANGGAMAFVDDYSASVTGPSSEANYEGIQTIINGAID